MFVLFLLLRLDCNQIEKDLSDNKPHGVLFLPLVVECRIDYFISHECYCCKYYAVADNETFRFVDYS